MTRAREVLTFRADKSLGQHFLTDAEVIARMVAAARALDAEYRCGGNCVEIGPGRGVLTLGLLEAGFSVQAIEKDARSAAGLQEALAVSHPGKFKVRELDVLKHVPAVPSAGGTKPLCIGNLPYYISSDFLMWFIAHHEAYAAGLFMLQDEVADRLAAAPGTKAYGRLSVRLQLSFAVEKNFFVGPESFDPPPKVDSAVFTLRPKDFSFENAAEEDAFGRFTAALYSARRKMLRKTMQALFSGRPAAALELAWEICARYGCSPQSRPEELSPECVLEIFRAGRA